MPFGITGSTNDIGKKLFRTGVAVQHVIFSALFVVENKLHRDSRLTRPTSVRRTTTVAD
ncbi:hypothetical protein D3C80_1987840 [compost metagenome]